MNAEPGIAVTESRIGPSLSGEEMPDGLFSRFSKIIYEESGIHLQPGKKLMLSARLNRRLRSLGIRSFSEYYDLLCDNNAPREELKHFIDTVSTNKTEFFRESQHFDYLRSTALPALMKSRGFGEEDHLRIWSAGCSTGEEAYTLAVVVDDFFRVKWGDYSVLGTDISTRVLEKARMAVYPDGELKTVPRELMRRYFMKGVREQEGKHRVAPEIRGRVSFMRHNLVKDDYRSMPPMDIIFCRNVAIYFDRETQKSIYGRLSDKLVPGGYLFIGHSEMMTNDRKNMERVGPTIYRKKE